jgi:putative ABC transport system permease protein
MNDLKFTLRQLLKNPGFTAVAVLTLALGIGAASAVFSLIQGVLLTPPPYRDPNRIVLVTPERLDGQRYSGNVPGKQWLEWQAEAQSLEAVAGYGWDFCFLLLPEGSESLQGVAVTKDYFRVLGNKPVLGRAFVDSDASTRETMASAVILGYDLWQRRFHGDPDIIGSTIKLRHNESPPVTHTVTVVGVTPAGVRFLPSPRSTSEPNYDVNAHVDFWYPIAADPKWSWWQVVARLRDNVTLTQAQTELTAITARQARGDRALQGITAKAQPLTVELNRDGRRLLLPLMGAVMMVLLIACSNVAGLLLARGLQRQQEYAVRCALGAGRLRLVRQVLTESLFLGLLGGGLGVFLAVATVRLLKAIGGFAIPRLDAVTLGWPVVGFCFGLAVLAAALAGLGPALRASRLDPACGMKAAGPASGTGRNERRLLGGVAMLQAGLTLALLTGAGLLIRTVNNLARVRPGYDAQNILTMSVTTMADANKFIDFHAQALARISALAGVRQVAFGWGLPLTGNKFGNASVKIEGQPDLEKLAVNGRAVTPEYFDALGIRLAAGRSFRSTDNWNDWNFKTHEYVPGETPFVAVINQALAEKCFPNANPIGKKLRAFPWEDRPCEIVGVVANTRTESLTKKAEPEIYWCYWQFPPFTKHLVVRTESDPRPLVSAVQRELRAVEPTVAIEHVKTLEQIRSDSVAPQTFAMRLLTGFSLVACGLALVGIYGVLALSVSARKREIAIRIAVGARRWDVLGLVLGEGSRLIAVGVVLGAGVTLVSARVLKAFLFEVEPNDPATLGVIATLFAAVGLMACWGPAHRATKVEPMEALRHE